MEKAFVYFNFRKVPNFPKVFWAIHFDLDKSKRSRSEEQDLEINFFLY